jgi:hypothetical protein
VQVPQVLKAYMNNLEYIKAWFRKKWRYLSSA